MTEHNLNYSSFPPLPCFELPFLFLLFLPLIFLCHLNFILNLPFLSLPYVHPPLLLLSPSIIFLFLLLLTLILLCLSLSHCHLSFFVFLDDFALLFFFIFFFFFSFIRHYFLLLLPPSPPHSSLLHCFVLLLLFLFFLFSFSFFRCILSISFIRLYSSSSLFSPAPTLHSSLLPLTHALTSSSFPAYPRTTVHDFTLQSAVWSHALTDHEKKPYRRRGMRRKLQPVVQKSIGLESLRAAT